MAKADALSRLRALAAGVLVTLAGVEGVAHIAFARRAPSLNDYAVLRAPIRELRAAGDAVVVVPEWAQPMVRAALGEDLPLESVAPPDLSSVRAVVEVSVGGHHHAELVGWRQVASQRHGGFVVRRLENPAPIDVVFDFVNALEPQNVLVTLPGADAGPGARCMYNPLAAAVAGGLGGHPTWPNARFVCPGPPHLTVGRTVIADASWRPRRCVLAHPPARGELAIVYRDVELGERIVGHGGLSWMTERARRGAPVELRVEIDGQTIGTFIHADGDGWASFEMAVPSATARGDVTFFVSSPSEVGRDFCFEARSS